MHLRLIILFVVCECVVLSAFDVEKYRSYFERDRSPDIWYTYLQTAAQFQNMWCSYSRCTGNELIHRPQRADSCLECNKQCSCEEYCEIEGTCCTPVGQEWRPPPLHQSICTSAPYGHKFTGESPVYIVIECHPRFNVTGKSRELCGRADTLPRRRETVRPVTSLDTKVTYANVYCAECNYDNDSVVAWEIACQHSQYLHDASSDLKYDERAVLMPNVCGVKRIYKDGNTSYQYHDCEPSWHHPHDVISSCWNVTGFGRESDRDEHVREACEKSNWSIGAVVKLRSYGRQLYANIFCAMCNQNSPRCYFTTPQPVSTTARPDKGPMASMDLDVRTLQSLIDTRSHRPEQAKKQVSRESSNCSPDQWPHPKGDCKQLTCTAGKQWKEGNKCVTAVDRVRGLGYSLKLLLVPLRLIRLIRLRSAYTIWNEDYQVRIWDDDITFCDYASALDTVLRSIMGNKVTDISSNVTTSTTLPGEEDSSSIRSAAPAPCFRQMYQAKLEGLMQDENVTKVSDVSFVLYQLGLDMDEVRDQARFLAARMHVHLVANSADGRDDVEKDLLVLATTSIWNVSFGEWSILLKAQVDNTDNNDTQDDDNATQAWYGGEQTEMHTFPYGNRAPMGPKGLEHLFLPLSDLMLCPYVTFDSTEFDVQGTVDNVTLTFPRYLYDDLTPVSLQTMTLFASSSEWAVSEDKQLMMCENFFSRAFPPNVTLLKSSAAEASGASLGHKIASAVCGSVSVLCLLLTLLTYSLFSQLRALPGLNNMGLSASLALAQLSLLVPWHRTGNADVCRAVGVFTHWLWLQALGWMAVCCTHMMRVFTSKVRNTLTERKTRRVFLYNVLFTAMLSAAVVGVTVGVAQGVSDGSSMGYGGSLCFLDTSYSPLLGLAFVIPLALVLITDLVCFTLTVISIARVRRLQPEAGHGGQQPNASRWDVLVYLKLVTVTGGAWVLEFVAQAVDSEWVRVLAELCTAGQGLLIFLAYVCNVRVWHLYQDRFGLRRPDTVTTTTSTSANTTNTTTTRATVSSTSGNASVESKENTRI